MIYDTFIFFNELDLLEIRLNELDPYVDKFVLVESTKTFTHIDKPLYYLENKKRFERFHKKIIHIIVKGFVCGDPWKNEYKQRDAISRGLVKCKPGDVILLSDVDEIPAPVVFQPLVEDVYNIEMRTYWYFLNLRIHTDYIWMHPKIFKYSYIKTNISEIRKHQYKHTIACGGYHFAYMGGPERIAEKLRAFSHTECATDDLTNVNNIKRRIKSSRAVFNGLAVKDSVENVINLPKYIQDNTIRFKHLIT